MLEQLIQLHKSQPYGPCSVRERSETVVARVSNGLR
jgi:hypothetical protein